MFDLGHLLAIGAMDWEEGGGGGGVLYFTSCNNQSIYFAKLKLTILAMDSNGY